MYKSNQDINGVDNSSDINKSQSIDINSINPNNHVSDNCESSSIEINNISLSNITTNNHLSSDNVATRVKESTQEDTSLPSIESRSYEY